MPQRRLAILLGAVAIATTAVLSVASSQEEGSLPEGYWRFPLAPQRAAPASWPKVEQSLRPEACGTCHSDQYAQWQGSVHARAFSSGLLGQLLSFDEREEVEACMNCHAPLAEQKEQFFAAIKGDRSRDDVLVPATSGNGCAGCHVREHRRFGPPARDGSTKSRASAPHGGATRLAAFERSDFCAGCHQFPAEMAVNGKPLENTYAEWQASRFASEGRSCQSCHMPDRKHLFRGIHDPAMVASGLTARATAGPEGAHFSLTSSAVGHAFPTYATPKAVMRMVALDDDGRELPETAREHVIQRRVKLEASGWVELADTRLMPDETASLDLPWGERREVKVWLDVLPDDFYHREVYPDVLKDLEGGSPPATFIRQAIGAAERSRFRLFERIVKRP